MEAHLNTKAVGLVAEDEHLTRWNIAGTLRMEHHEVDEAPDGKTAVNFLSTKRYDAVVSDFGMPGSVNGVDVLVCYHALCPENPAVLITAQDGEIQRDVEAFGGIYLRKPFFVEDLVALLNRRLRHLV